MTRALPSTTVAALTATLLLAACTPPTPPGGGEAVEERCESTSVSQDPSVAPASAEAAAAAFEADLPPPLRTAGTGITLDGELVGEVQTEQLEDGGVVVVAFDFCVPPTLDLTRIDLADGITGDWALSGSDPALALPPEAEVTLEIGDVDVFGRSVCNEHFGFVAAGPGGAWRVSSFSATEAACDVPDEAAYLARFATATTWALEDGELVLTGPEGTLRFQRTDG